MPNKLNYKIVGRTTRMAAPVDRPGVLLPATMIDTVAIEWRHDDGPIKDTVFLPTSHPRIHPSMPELTYEEFTVASREVIKDSIDVPHGTPDSIVAMACEEKRARLAANLGVSP